jgi:hypothetical protein
MGGGEEKKDLIPECQNLFWLNWPPGMNMFVQELDFSVCGGILVTRTK